MGQPDDMRAGRGSSDLEKVLRDIVSWAVPCPSEGDTVEFCNQLLMVGVVVGVKYDVCRYVVTPKAREYLRAQLSVRVLDWFRVRNYEHFALLTANVQGDRRCAASSRSVQRAKRTGSTAGLALTGLRFISWGPRWRWRGDITLR